MSSVVIYHPPDGDYYGGLPTVIARYGHAGPEYTSGMALADVDPLLGEARRRAVERGLVSPHAKGTGHDD